jgi:hypothetical protein
MYLYSTVLSAFGGWGLTTVVGVSVHFYFSARQSCGGPIKVLNINQHTVSRIDNIYTHTTRL